MPVPLHRVIVEHYRLTPHDDVVQPDVLALAAVGHRHVWLVYDRPDPWRRDWAAQHGIVSQLMEFHRGYVFRVALN